MWGEPCSGPTAAPRFGWRLGESFGPRSRIFSTSTVALRCRPRGTKRKETGLPASFLRYEGIPSFLVSPSVPPMLAQFLASLLGLKPAANENGNNNKTPATAPSPAPSPAISASAPAPAGTDALSKLQSVERPPYPPVTSPRSLRQLGLFFGGAGFLFVSVMITRRAAARYQIASQLKYFQPSNGNGLTHQGPPPKDPLMALQALNLATLNTLSFAIMMAGGVSWALDISSAEDLKRLARRSMAKSGGGELDQAAEEEVAQWVAKTLGIKETSSSDEDNKS